jgi:hypothetical protein
LDPTNDCVLPGSVATKLPEAHAGFRLVSECGSFREAAIFQLIQSVPDQWRSRLFTLLTTLVLQRLTSRELRLRTHILILHFVLMVLTNFPPARDRLAPCSLSMWVRGWATSGASFPRSSPNKCV